MPPTDADLATPRAAEIAFMRDSCQIFRPTETSDGRGGTTVAYPGTPTATSNCRFAPVRLPAEVEAGGALTAIQRFAFRFPYDLAEAIGPKHRLKVGTRTFEVTKNVPVSNATAILVEAVALE